MGPFHTVTHSQSGFAMKATPRLLCRCVGEGTVEESQRGIESDDVNSMRAVNGAKGNSKFSKCINCRAPLRVLAAMIRVKVVFNLH